MSSSTGTRKQRDVQSRANEAINEGDKALIESLKLFSGESNSVAGLAGSTGQNSPQTPAGNYLAREGDSMIGPIALGPPVNFRVQIGTEENINISNLGDSPQYSSNIELDSVQPNGFVLDRIDGAAFDGQILVIRTFGPDPFTISQATLANGGNIQTPNDEDFELPALSMIQLVFDEALLVFANTGGTWRVMSGGDVGGTNVGTYASAVMDQDQVANMGVNDHFQFNDYVENGGIVLQGLTPTFDQTSGIFTLLAGKTYFLYADVSAEFNSNADSAQIVWYDRTNAAELGARGKSNPLSSAGQLTNKHSVETIITPVTDIDVEVRIVALVGTINTAFSNASQANIFEFSGKNGAQGPAGAAGSGINWKEPARAKSTADIPNLASADVIFDGITLIEDDRVLLTDQTDESENGLWQVGVVAAGFAPLTRPDDFDTDIEVVAETFVPIEEGNTQANQLWHLISNNPLTIDVSDQIWDIFAPGTSGGPDLGGGEDGIDAAGEFVNDGRVSLGNYMVQLWEQTTNLLNNGPTGGRLLWIPPFGEVAGRLVIIGGQQGGNTKNSQYTDDFGDTWTNSTLDTEDSWGVIAYDPTGRSGSAANPAQGITVAGSSNGVFNTGRNLRRSIDRGANYFTIVSPNTDLHRDLIWAQDGAGQFVITNYTTGAPPPSNIRGIWTSPDGSTWTVRVTPAPTENVNQSWSFVAYSDSLDLYIATTLGDAGGGAKTDMMFSSDAITWTRFSSNISLFGIKRIIWSEGQQKFVILSFDPVADIGYANVSEDGINWTQFQIAATIDPNSLSMSDIVWSPNLSLYVVSGGRSDVGFRFTKFWVSNDAETWEELARLKDSPGVSGFGSLAYSEEYTKFWCAQSIIANEPNVFRTIR